jgi:hypothetical protein
MKKRFFKFLYMIFIAGTILVLTSQVRADDLEPLGFGASCSRTRAVCGGAEKPCIDMHPPWKADVAGRTAVRFSLDLPGDAGLAAEFYAGLKDGAPTQNGVRFEVRINSKKVFEKVVARPSGWHPVRIDLGPYAGNKVTLEISTDPMGNPGGDWARVGEPCITAGKRVLMDLLDLLPRAGKGIILIRRGVWIPVNRYGDLFLKGEPLVLKVQGLDNKTSEVIIFREGERDPVFRKSVAVEKGRLNIPWDTSGALNGPYRVEVSGKKKRVWFVPPPEKRPEDERPLIGVIIGGGNPNITETARRLGVRLVKVNFLWSWMEPEKGRYNWFQDRFIDSLTKAGIPVGAIICNTPRWASAAPDDTEIGPDNNQAYKLHPPRDMGDWENFVRQAVRRYGDRLHHVEIWNEPSCSFYKGDVETFIRMTKTAIRVIRKERPGLKILGPNVNNFNAFAQKVFRECADDYDALCIHYEARFRLMEKIKPFMKKLGKNRSIWNSEAGGLGFSDFEGNRGQPIKNIVQNLAVGLDHIFLFNWAPYKGNPNMVAADRSVAERAIHFRTAVDMLAGVKFVKREQKGNARMYTFKKPGDRELRVAWSLKGRASWSFEKAPKALYDRFGNPVKVAGRIIELTEDPVFIVRK